MEAEESRVQKKRKEFAKREQGLLTPETSPPNSPLHKPNQTQRGMHMTREKKRNIAKYYRDNSKLREQIEN